MSIPATRTALLIDAAVTDANAPKGVYENLIVSSSQIGALIADVRLQGVSLTGSEEAGRIVAEQAGRHLKKCVLELGGSDPFIVLPDADLDLALDLAATGRFSNAGQSCTSSKRLIVHSDVYDRFLEGFVERAKQWNTGGSVRTLNEGVFSLWNGHSPFHDAPVFLSGTDSWMNVTMLAVRRTSSTKESGKAISPSAPRQ